MNDQPSLEFWFEFGSNYSYLSLMRIEALAAQAKVPLVWKPFLLGPIFKDLGWATSPFVLQKEKGNYVWKDIERQAAKYALPFKKPSVFPRVAVLPMRVAVLAADKPWIAAFCTRVMQQNWVDDVDINDEQNVLRALDGIVDNPAAILSDAQQEANKLRLRQNTEEARRLGIFGAPSFFVNGEMFWGNDRLDDAIAFATRVAAIPSVQ